MLNFNFGNKQIVVSDDVEKIAELTKKRIAVKSKYMARILAAYDKAGSIENFMENFSDVSGNIVGMPLKMRLIFVLMMAIMILMKTFFWKMEGKNLFSILCLMSLKIYLEPIKI